MLADTPLPHGFGAALASVDTFFPRAPEQFVTSPLCLVGYVRWDARSDRVLLSRQSFSAALQVALKVADHPFGIAESAAH